MEQSTDTHDTLNLVAIAHGPDDVLQAYALVLSAVGIEHGIDPDSETLVVAREDVETALRQLNSYREENKDWPPTKEVAQHPPFTTPQVTLLLIGLLILFFLHAGGWYPENPWFTAGAVNRNSFISQTEWWRIVTALTLHADIVHLAGNCLIGGHMISFLSRTVGYGLCWFLVVLCGAAGNLANILVREQQHLSVGFSTAVFATIGIFTGLAMSSGNKPSIKQYIAPLGAGLGLLVFLGSEGARTDIGAHFFGFLCGIFSGIGTGITHLVQRTASGRVQFILLCTALGLVFGSWFAAIHSYPVLQL